MFLSSSNLFHTRILEKKKRSRPLQKQNTKAEATELAVMALDIPVHQTKEKRKKTDPDYD